jgi:hypothetical protein
MKIYSKEETIKVLDIVIDDIDNVSYFSIKEILARHREYNEREQGYLFVEIESLGKSYNLFEFIENSRDLYKLTPKGIDLKEFGKGFNAFEKKLKSKPLDLYQKIYLPFFILFGLFGIYKVFQPSVSVSDFQKLNTDFGILKSDFDSLTVRFDSLILENVKKTPPKTELPNDTSQTKNYTGLSK